jgi:hypothetical protein
MTFRTRLLPIFTVAIVASVAVVDLLVLVSPRVKGGPGIAPSGEWRFDNLWLEGARP